MSSMLRPLLVLFALLTVVTGIVYPLAVAHAFDYVERDHMVAASAGMLLSWSLGATAGPLLASPPDPARPDRDGAATTTS